MSEVLDNLRFKHHTIAIWVAHGLTAEQLQQLAKIPKARTDSLLQDPSFQELVQYYRDHGQYKEPTNERPTFN